MDKARRKAEGHVSNQQQQFFNSERPPNQYYEAQNVNTDPREQQQQMMYGGPEYYAGAGEKLRPQPPRRRRSRWWWLLVPILLILLVSAPFSMYSAFHHEHYGRGPSFARPIPLTGFSAPTLIIKDDSGSVHVGTDEHITNSIQVNADDNNVAESYDQQTNTVTITTSGSADIAVTTPQNTNLQVQENSGDVNITGLRGQTSVTDNSGSISVESFSGQLNLSSDSGSIEVTDSTLSGQSKLQSNSDSIHFNGSLDRSGAYDFESNSGSIDITLPGDASFRLDETTNGSFNNDFGGPNVGSSPQPTLTIKSDSGSIQINKGS